MSTVVKKKPVDKDKENVAAALDQLDSASATVAKATNIVRRRIEELEEVIGDLDSRLQEISERHKAEMQHLKDQYLKENTALSTRLASAEEKLRKVQQTLS